MSAALRILGIDPGLNRTGYGVIELSGSRLGYVAAGVIRVPPGELHERLGTILNALAGVIRETRPQVATVEKVFVNVNPQSTLLLAQARGAAICAAVSEGLAVHEYAALRIKHRPERYLLFPGMGVQFVNIDTKVQDLLVDLVEALNRSRNRDHS